MTELLVCFILLFASIQDIKTRKVENRLMLLLLLTVIADATVSILGNQRFHAGSLLQHLLSAALVFFSFLWIGLRSHGVGGADIKAASLLALRAGLPRTLLFIPLSFLVLTLYFLIGKLRRQSDLSAPFLPFLSVSYFVSLPLLG